MLRAASGCASGLFGLPAAAPKEPTSRSCRLADGDSAPVSSPYVAVWRNNELYVSPRRTNNITPRNMKSPTPRGLRRFATVGPSAGASTPAGAATPPTSEDKAGADGVRLSLFLPRSGRVTPKSLLGSLQSFLANLDAAATGHRVHRSLRVGSPLPRRPQPAQPSSPAQQGVAGASQQPAMCQAPRATDGNRSVAPSGPEQEDKAAVGQLGASTLESAASGAEVASGSLLACDGKPPSPLPLRRTGSLRRPSTDSAFDAAELPQPTSLLQPSQPAARPGPKQHADLLLRQLPWDAGTTAQPQASGADDSGCGEGDWQERPGTPRCVECASPVLADAPASALAAASAFASPLGRRNGAAGLLGNPGTSVADGSPSLPCPAAYVLQRGGLEGLAAPITAPRPRRMSALHTPPAQLLTASPAGPKVKWLSLGGASSAADADGGATTCTTARVTGAAAVLQAPLSPTGAAVVFVRATATNAAVMASLSSDKSQVAAVAACALTSDGGSLAGSTIGGATAHMGAAKAGGAGVAGSSPASACGLTQGKARTARVQQRSALSVRQSAGGACGGGASGAGTVSSGSSSLAGGLHGAGGALPRYLQTTASFAAKQGSK
ncbi:hypothetical protein CHLRE_09g393802v5 [Chlamydomonas reinhardtii]|uniref:Uncharacterized protein n=1 Tax=Chlamydomonas reinhardtii TaxID=3055 RepID=A0A2K3DEE4_CHLRE|nr:uncharacterized protein CHLRE_09g393802v5 [Chlamydomonas reinhardtii]PNW78899.1 hypothetical protein CHLRE_09g393802v5 [Chlamydomonas reinhardtii]